MNLNDAEQQLEAAHDADLAGDLELARKLAQGVFAGLEAEDGDDAVELRLTADLKLAQLDVQMRDDEAAFGRYLAAAGKRVDKALDELLPPARGRAPARRPAWSRCTPGCWWWTITPAT